MTRPEGQERVRILVLLVTSRVGFYRINSFPRICSQLEPHPLDWHLTEFDSEITDWQRGIVLPDELEKNAKISPTGPPALELYGCERINGAKLNLADLKGKFVLLDFWFIGCGPFQADFLSMTIAHESYKDNGLVVIGIHNDSN